LFENQQRLGAPLYQSIVKELQLDAAQLRAALEANTYLAKVRADFNGGVRSGVNGTPSFFVNGKRYDGAPDFETMAEVLGQAIRTAKPHAR
jgi:protein-disulfide isomerase